MSKLNTDLLNYINKLLDKSKYRASHKKYDYMTNSHVEAYGTFAGDGFVEIVAHLTNGAKNSLLVFSYSKFNVENVLETLDTLMKRVRHRELDDIGSYKELDELLKPLRSANVQASIKFNI